MSRQRITHIIGNNPSSWNGSHRNLVKLINTKMNNPASFEHVSTKWSDYGDYIAIFCTFRGTNSFNAVVKNSITAKADIDRTIFELKK